ncbi:hypothetical protein GGR55DRAFT_701902 [Xylaria sp. FL0064]|nr:hypothetical protein GGR55DRAFT_701902 [Xylaria sp. FL0064]
MALSAKLEKKISIGSFSSVVYDTAWLARVFTRTSNPVWLFPQCFEYLLKTQNELGGWPSAGSETNDILNTMAAIIAFKDHEVRSEITPSLPAVDLSARLEKAERYLRKILGKWDISSTVHVGFEILVPSMIEVLEDASVPLNFAGRENLMSLYRQKMSSLQLDILYTNHKTTLLHSLEAFVGKLDFDRVAHHIDEHGSMMASPAATAAYLMHSSHWDKAAEQYLHHVVTHGSGKGNGGVPSAFPTSIFEVTWIVSSLLKTSIASNILSSDCATIIRSYLERQLNLNNGVVGWDSGVLADADDTAKTILSLQSLGLQPDPSAMIKQFQAAGHFETYKRERNASLSTNCNILDALLHTPNTAEYASQISGLASFICDVYFAGRNVSEYYSTMLVSQVLVKLLQTWGDGTLDNLAEDLTSFRVPVILLQIAIRSIQLQWPDGSWSLGNCESTDPTPQITAYAVLSLKSLELLPWITILQPRIREAIQKGLVYIRTHLNSNLDHETIWVEKVTYALPSVSRAYCVAALCPATPCLLRGRALSIAEINFQKVQQLATFFSQLPLFSGDAMWALEADVALGYLYQAKLRRASSRIFPQRRSVTSYQYLEYIPFTWIATNRRNGYPLSNNQIWEAMEIAVLDYQLDEYMETTCDQAGIRENISALKLMVKELCNLTPDSPADSGSILSTNHRINVSGPEDDDTGNIESHHSGSDEDMITTSGSVCGESRDTTPNWHVLTTQEKIRSVLHCFTSHIFHHHAVARAPTRVRKSLQSELATCILAHIDHAVDNNHFAAQRNTQITGRCPSQTVDIPMFEAPRGSYYSWVCTTGADDTHAPFTFQFFACLTASTTDGVFFCGVREKYFSSAASRHLANLCRQYNDLGSVARDKAEKNLNSLNFPEFHETDLRNSGDLYLRERDETDMKHDLYFLAQYERQCLNHTMQVLTTEMKSGPQGDWKIRALKVFVDTVDLYGQMYVLRDVTRRVK